MTRKEVKALGITDEDQISAFLNAYKGAVEDFKEDYMSKQKPVQPVTRTEPDPKPVQQPAEQPPASNQASASDEVEQLRRELAAEKAKLAQRERRDAIMATLATHKPRNADTIYKLLDVEKIAIKDGKIEGGLDDQIKAIRAEQGYLFTDTPDNKGGAEATGGAPGTPTMNDFFRGIGG